MGDSLLDLMGAMAPLVFGITRRFPLQRESRMGNAFVHLAAGVVNPVQTAGLFCEHDVEPHAHF